MKIAGRITVSPARSRRAGRFNGAGDEDRRKVGTELHKLRAEPVASTEPAMKIAGRKGGLRCLRIASICFNGAGDEDRRKAMSPHTMGCCSTQLQRSRR